MTAPPPLLTPPFLRLMGAHFLQALGFSSMILLPTYLDHLGASRSAVGAVMASAAVGGLLTRPAVGGLLDGWGRKPTLVVGTLVVAIAMLGVALVDRVGVAAYAVRVVFGVGVGALFTGYFTLASDLVPEARRTEGIAIFGVSGLVPLAINPIATRIGIDPPLVRWFLPVVGLVILGSLVLLAGVPEPDHARPAGRPKWSAVGRALRARPLWSVWLADIVFSALVATFMAFSLVVAAGRGIEQAADLWFAYAAGAVVVRLGGATLPRRVGPSRLLAVTLLCYVGGVALLSVADAWPVLLVAGGLAGVGHGYCFPILSAQVVTRAPVATRGSAMAMFTGIWDLTKLVAPPALGVVADVWGDARMLQLCVVLALVTIVAWAALEVGQADGTAISEA